jgi:SAM-dependent methyltransferase
VFERLGLDATSTVLDIGCGCGGLGLALRERFGIQQYTGIEINRRAAQTARLMNPTGRFLAADILKLAPHELAEESFDIVVSLSCIDWNVQFAEMVRRAYGHVKPGGYFVSSFRLTSGESTADIRRSYQYIDFEGKRQGEMAPYIILNVNELLRYLTALEPARIFGFGYWGLPSPTAVTPLSKVCFAVVATKKRAGPVESPVIELDLPPDLLSAVTRE